MLYGTSGRFIHVYGISDSASLFLVFYVGLSMIFGILIRVSMFSGI